MSTTQNTLASVLEPHLDRFFAAHQDLILQDRTWEMLHRLKGIQLAITGKAEGWAAGLVYAVATWGRQPCGVPKISNRDFEALFNTTMSTVYQRAAAIRRAVEPTMTEEDHAVFFAGWAGCTG